MKCVEAWIVDWRTNVSLTLAQQAAVILLRAGHELDEHLRWLETNLRDQPELFGLHVENQDSGWWACVLGPLRFSKALFQPLHPIDGLLNVGEPLDVYGSQHLWSNEMRTCHISSSGHYLLLKDIDWWSTLYASTLSPDAKQMVELAQDWLEQWPKACLCWHLVDWD